MQLWGRYAKFEDGWSTDLWITPSHGLDAENWGYAR